MAATDAGRAMPGGGGFDKHLMRRQGAHLVQDGVVGGGG